MKTTKNSKHHYVPQMLLRRFAVGLTEQLFAFDKTNSHSFKLSIKDAAAEKGFNATEWHDQVICVEDFYTNIEASAAPILNRIVESRCLWDMQRPEREELTRFLAAQMYRTRAHRAMNEQLGSFMRMFAAAEGSRGFQDWVGAHDAEREKLEHLKSTEKMVNAFSDALLTKDFILLQCDPGSQFVVGDNPLVATNTLNRSKFRGTTGLLNEKVEVYLPLSPEFTLGVMCRTIQKDFRKAVILLGRSAGNFILDYLLALETKRTLKIAAENTKFYNSLQITRSERFIYSGKDDFEIAKEMMQNNPELRMGPRPVIINGGREVRREDIDAWSSEERTNNRI